MASTTLSFAHARPHSVGVVGSATAALEKALVGHPKAHRAYLERRKFADVAVQGVLIQGGTAVVVGRILGEVHARKGLDHKIGSHNVAADLALFGVLSVAAVATARSSASEHVMNIAAAAGAVYGFRTGDASGAQKMALGGKLPAAATSKSPLPAAAPPSALPAAQAVAAGEFGVDAVARSARLAQLARRLP